MTDEKYTFISDVRDKKRTAAGSYHKRTHAGKGGAVKFPSDYLSRKELKAMSGETKSYRLNSPMSWEEFTAMPDDIKCTYIRLLRERYSVPDVRIAEMMGVNKDRVSLLFKKIGCRSAERKHGTRPYDKEGWNQFVGNVQTVKPEEPAETKANTEEQTQDYEQEAETVHFPLIEEKTIPCSGEMTFNGAAEDVLQYMINILGCVDVQMTVKWVVVEGE